MFLGIDPKQRSTEDLVVLAFTGVVCAVIVGTTVMVAILEIINSEIETDNIVELEYELVQVITGALVGFIGGRGVGEARAWRDSQMIARGASTERPKSVSGPDDGG